jgi:hypothetical protein
VIILSPNASATDITFPAAGIYDVTLIINQGTATEASTTITVDVNAGGGGGGGGGGANPEPTNLTIDAPANGTCFNTGQIVTFTASATDPGDQLTYTWSIDGIAPGSPGLVGSTVSFVFPNANPNLVAQVQVEDTANNVVVSTPISIQIAFNCMMM